MRRSPGASAVMEQKPAKTRMDIEEGLKRRRWRIGRWVYSGCEGYMTWAGDTLEVFEPRAEDGDRAVYGWESQGNVSGNWRV